VFAVNQTYIYFYSCFFSKLFLFLAGGGVGCGCLLGLISKRESVYGLVWSGQIAGSPTANNTTGL
jgi:hypothetical protein